MTYFELYENPINLLIDNSYLKKRYYQLSKIHHPDQVSLLDSAAQTTAIEASTLVNKGYAILGNATKRFDYVLQLLKIIQPEDNYKLSPDFLMQMMELNEQIMDAKLDNDFAQLNKCTAEIQGLESALLLQINWLWKMPIIEHLDDAQHQQLKKYYYEIKYIQRVKDLLADKQVDV